ncbi:hypothetical protein SETIT_2G154200v2 [Setaria italica]|uniref:FAE domain-containing protein n=1 Tax=Setaria italica TaxID=4555 RepID=A0A368PZ48_SETIT|nr:hypothetical protein SETIT_2G154200v2 [Setaria italica]
MWGEGACDFQRRLSPTGGSSPAAPPLPASAPTAIPMRRHTLRQVFFHAATCRCPRRAPSLIVPPPPASPPPPLGDVAPLPLWGRCSHAEMGSSRYSPLPHGGRHVAPMQGGTAGRTPHWGHRWRAHLPATVSRRRAASGFSGRRRGGEDKREDKMRGRRISIELAGHVIQRNKWLGLPDYHFLLVVIVRSGIGEETYAPRSILEGRADSPTLQDALDKMDAFLDDAVSELFTLAVCNVSMLSPVPSLASRIVCRYGLREDVAAYNLAGMGCNAGLIALDLARNALHTRPRVLALVVPPMSIAPNWYSSTDKSTMLANCLIRSGDAAVLITKNPARRGRAKMKLCCLVHVHIGGFLRRHRTACRKPATHELAYARKEKHGNRSRAWERTSEGATGEERPCGNMWGAEASDGIAIFFLCI